MAVSFTLMLKMSLSTDLLTSITHVKIEYNRVNNDGSCNSDSNRKSTF